MRAEPTDLYAQDIILPKPPRSYGSLRHLQRQAWKPLDIDNILNLPTTTPVAPDPWWHDGTS